MSKATILKIDRKMQYDVVNVRYQVVGDTPIPEEQKKDKDGNDLPMKEKFPTFEVTMQVPLDSTPSDIRNMIKAKLKTVDDSDKLQEMEGEIIEK